MTNTPSLPNVPNEDQMDPELQKFLKDYREGTLNTKDNVNSTKEAGTKPKAGEQPAHTDFLTMLVAARRARHMRQSDLAAKANMPQSSLARIESGKGNPSLQTLQKLVDALDMELQLRPR